MTPRNRHWGLRPMRLIDFGRNTLFQVMMISTYGHRSQIRMKPRAEVLKNGQEKGLRPNLLPALMPIQLNKLD
jgi:hypothetical protein